MPRLGGRKLLYLLQKDGINIGRDKLFDVLRHENMLVKKRKRKVFTTQSKHWLMKKNNPEPIIRIGFPISLPVTMSAGYQQEHKQNMQAW